ncbi:MAG TPA: glucosylglycerol-phosphate synthase [Longimicrobiales bacterium]|nr:glucosylglycerol-phosphate synthase [Longimicrobiales bacterium]
MILATDLDGTFLGGAAEGRRRLYRLLRETPEAMVIFVTGRGVASVQPLLDDPEIPDPDYIIGDVGASVVDGHTLEPVSEVQGPIEERWPGTPTVRETLKEFDTLIYQEVPQERRCSFLVRDGKVPAGLAEVVEGELGCELLLSAGRYLDVLPAGVSKGNSLLALLAEKGLDHERVVVAGDTLNDLSLFQVDLKGVVVGGAEAALSAKVLDMGVNAYVAEAEGGAGILEGLEHHDMLSGPIPEAEAEGAPADQQLVMVYHRLPFDEVKRKGKIERRRPKSPNGIIPTLLGFFQEGRRGVWVAWSKQESRDPPDWEPRVDVDPERYPDLTALRIPLTRQDVKLFYEAFSKEAFWPVIFSFPDRAEFDASHWRHYLEINRLFAEQAAAAAEPGALVWVHDYNLWMVPHFLRELRPDVKIAFFHHTTFPSSDIFNIIPWRKQIVDSLIQCDYVGFHIPRYVENFVDVLRSHAPMEVVRKVPTAPRFLSFGCALGIDEMATEIEVKDRRVRLGAHPVGINVKAIHDILEKPRVRKMMNRFEAEMGERTSILSIERLDYVKGPLEKLQAFEKLLDDHPELHGEITLLTVSTPPAPGMRVYRSTRERVDQAVGRINGRFSRVDWTPVRYFYRSLPYEEVVAHYAVTDVAWITPLRDGLNMVAKEYIAANSAMDGNGTLVLSEFAGASAELHGALLTNPYDPEQMADDLYQALMMPEKERRERMAVMHEIVDANNISYWGYEFLSAVNGRL